MAAVRRREHKGTLFDSERRICSRRSLSPLVRICANYEYQCTSGTIATVTITRPRLHRDRRAIVAAYTLHLTFVNYHFIDYKLFFKLRTIKILWF